MTGYPLSIGVDLRQKREQKIPETYFGNMFLLSTCNYTKESVETCSLFDVALSCRKSILQHNETFVQSCIDRLSQLEYFQFFGEQYFPCDICKLVNITSTRGNIKLFSNPGKFYTVLARIYK